MKKLTEKEYWNSIYESKILGNKQHFLKRNLKILIKTILGKNILEYMRSYSDYFLWEVIYKRFMPKTKGIKVLEIGSAPGNSLVRLSQTFGFVPYGIEFSEHGVKLNKKIFILHNINPDNVIQADFLSDDFDTKYKEYFDIVISRGFIEHFTDIEDVIWKHINLLTKEGYLIVSIPNLRGVNYALMWFFHKELLPMHNINIMEKRRFSKLFNKKGLSTLFCDYYGTFNFGLFNTERNSPMRFALPFCNISQLILNVVFRLFFKNRGAESRIFSPYLIFIGKKKINAISPHTS